jgi:hypothetical protein
VASSVNAYTPFRPGESELERVNKLNNVLKGKLIGSDVGVFTLNASRTATGVSDSRITPNSVFIFNALTTQAGSAFGSMYIISRTNGVATVGHQSLVATPMNMSYFVLG